MDQSGTTLAILLGGMKMMMPNLIKYPKIIIPIILNGFVSGLGVYFLTIQGTPQTAGFGIVGLVGPIQAINMGSSLITAALAYCVIPFGSALLIDFICNKVVKVYEHEIFKFVPATN